MLCPELPTAGPRPGTFQHYNQQQPHPGSSPQTLGHFRSARERAATGETRDHLLRFPGACRRAEVNCASDAPNGRKSEEALLQPLCSRLRNCGREV